MNSAEDYQAARAQILRVVAQGGRRISLVEFTALPQLLEVLGDLRSTQPERPLVEVTYDPIQTTAPQVVETIQEKLSKLPAKPLPLIVLYPCELRATPEDEHAAYEFWQAMNFRRELLGGFAAQVLLCVDAWHLQRLVDRAPDLWTWLMPKIHFTEPSSLFPARTESLPALSMFAELQVSPEAAQRQWDQLWPELAKKGADHRVEAGDLRRYVFPLLESALAQGNLVRARQVRDLALGLPLADEDKVEWHKLNGRLACGAADFGQAEEHARQLLILQKQAPDPRSRALARDALNGLADVLQMFGQASMVEPLLRESLVECERMFGPEHPNTLDCRHHLAVAFRAQGKYSEAEQEHRLLLKLRKRVLGAEHPSVLVERIHLTTSLHAQGKHSQAERKYRTILRINEPLLGPEHPLILRIHNNLARTLAAQGKHAEAEREDRAVFKLVERVLGAEHVFTLSNRNNLAETLRARGKYSEAEHELRAVWKARERVLGPEHPHTLNTRNNLGNALCEQGRYGEAEQEYRAVLKLRERVLGVEHPHTAQSYHNLAYCLDKQGKAGEALEFARCAAERTSKILGPAHAETKLFQTLYQELTAKVNGAIR